MPESYGLPFNITCLTVMIRTILFLTPIFHTLTSGKDFTKFCRDFDLPEGTTMLYANCDNFQKAETAAEIDLHNCLPCAEGQTRVACPWGFCKGIDAGVFLVECSDGQGSTQYALGELLLFEDRFRMLTYYINK
jgi:hypothetical protein